MSRQIMLPAETKDNRAIVRAMKIIAARLRQIELRLKQLEGKDNEH